MTMNNLLTKVNMMSVDDRVSVSTRTSLRGLNILLLTPYTGGNLGDAAIQEALIHHLRARLSEPRIRLVTLAPQATSWIHGLPSFPISSSAGEAAVPPLQESYDENFRIERSVEANPDAQRVRYSWPRTVMTPVRRVVRRIGSPLKSVAREVRHLLQVRRLLKETDLLLMSGGGQIDDFWGGAFGHPYALWKWSVLARLCSTPVLFLSVGVCSLRSNLGRCFARQALQLAAYRSYRDQGSKELLHEATFTQSDPVYPDLAFSHPCTRQSAVLSPDSDRQHFVIGISPIAISSIVDLSNRAELERDPVIYDRYLQTLYEFTEKVLATDHAVVLFTSALMDQSVASDLQSKLRQNPQFKSWGDRLRLVNQTTLDRQLDEIRKMDMVVASRLHGIILSHLLDKPVLAISYDRKVRVHMETMAQERFCFDLRECTVPKLRGGLDALKSDSTAVSTVIHSRVREFGQELKKQYDFIAQTCSAAIKK
jgi:polysaccharide pyruvyl transferase WcaK-like protein